MSLRQLALEFDQSVKKYQELRVKRALEAAFDVTALAKSRVINRRVDHQDEIYGIYSDFTFKRKIKHSNDRRINFSDTNRMWASTLPEVIFADEKIIIIEIKPRDPNRLEVMDEHEERFGKPLIALNEAELDEFLELYGDITEDFKKYA